MKIAATTVIAGSEQAATGGRCAGGVAVVGTARAGAVAEIKLAAALAVLKADDARLSSGVVSKHFKRAAGMSD